MNRAIQTSPTPEGRTVIEDGAQYYIMGKNKIKITEHFPANGKPIDELIVDLIAHKIKEKAGKSI